MELNRKHWSVRLIEHTFGTDNLFKINNTCEYRKNLIFAFLLIPFSIISLPVMFLIKLIFKELIPTMVSFLITILLFILIIMFYVVFYGMWVDKELIVAGCMSIVLILTVGGLIAYSFIEDSNTYQDLIKSWKEKYCEPFKIK